MGPNSPVGIVPSLDLSAQVDRILLRNIQTPNQIDLFGVYAVTALEKTRIGNATGGAITYNLLTAVGIEGMRFTFKKNDASGNPVNVVAFGLELIDGIGTKTLATQYDTISIESNGTNWDIVVPLGSFLGGGAASFLEAVATGGTFSTGSLVYVPLPGTSIAFALTQPTVVFFDGYATAIPDGIFAVPNANLGLRVDGVDYFGTSETSLAAVTVDSGGMPVSKGLLLGIGAHTAELVVRAVFGGWAVATIASSATQPSRLTALFPAGATTPAVGQLDLNKILNARTTVAGNSDFVALPGGLTFRVLAAVADPFIYVIGTTIQTLTADVDLLLTDAANNFVWIDDVGALGSSAFPPVYAYAEPGAPAVDQHWFDLGQNQMRRWTGAIWAVVPRLFIGYARADGGAINAGVSQEPVGLDPYVRFAKYGDGSDGFLDVSAGTTTINGRKRYTAVVVRGAGVLNHTANSDQQLNIRAQTTISFIGTAGLDLNGLGSPGSVGSIVTPAGGSDGGFSATGGAGGGGTMGDGGKGGSGNVPANWNGLKARPAGGTAGTPPTAGAAGVANDFEPVGTEEGNLKAGGGGGGGGDTATAGGLGGTGGGTAILRSPTIVIGAAAFARANATAGAVAPAATVGAGGGGPGGNILAVCFNFYNSGTFTATSGAGGASGGANSGAGAAGGAGLAARIAA